MTQTTDQTDYEAAAHRAADVGFHVFPLLPGSKGPGKGMKFKELATRDHAQISAWWAANPNANIGIYCGKFRDNEALAVIDVDVKHGKDGFVEIKRRIDAGLDFPSTYEVRTPTGGAHIYYVVPKPLHTGTDKLGVGVDLKSAGGYVLGEGSTINGKPYVRAE